MSPDPTITFETPSHCDGSGHRPLQKGEHHSDALSSRHHRCIKSHRDLRRLRCWGETVDPTVGPGSQGRFALGLIHAPKERVVRGGTGGDVGEAKGWAEPWVLYLPNADKYRRLTRRPSQGQKGLDERASWPPSGPFTPGDALPAGRADTPTPRQLTATRRSLPCALFLTPALVVATAARGRAAPRAASRRDPSVQRPSRASAAASAWPSPCRALAPAAAAPGASWREASKAASSPCLRPGSTLALRGRGFNPALDHCQLPTIFVLEPLGVC
jgi:hypothetical protein